MKSEVASLTGRERTFGENEIIVSKTDLKGRIVYANRIFLDIAGYDEDEVVDAPHNLVRHPDMPRTVFKLLWDTIQRDQEIFAYVLNRCKNGDHYWVIAHVTPSHNAAGDVAGFHSNRRVPDRRVINDVIAPLYRSLTNEENRHGNRKDGLQAGSQLLSSILAQKGKSYDEFIFAL